MSYTQNERIVLGGGETIEFRDHTIFVDTSGGGFVLNMPLTPEVGEIHCVKDVGATFTANNLTVNGNGNNIEQPFVAVFAATALMALNAEAATWQFGTDSQWHLINAYKP